MLNFWFSSNDHICPDNYSYSRFKLRDKCRSEKWEVYLYGDMTIMVMESRRAENCGGHRSCFSWCDGKAFFGPCTQVHGQGSPAIRAGKGWRGRRELAPRCSATRISCISGAWQDRLRRVLIISTTRTTNTTHHTHHTTPHTTCTHNTQHHMYTHNTNTTHHMYTHTHNTTCTHTTPTPHTTCTHIRTTPHVHTQHHLHTPLFFIKICNDCNACNVCNFFADLFFSI